MHQAVRGHDWQMVREASDGRQARWKCSRCSWHMVSEKVPKRDRKVKYRDGTTYSCEEMQAVRVMAM